MLTDQYDLVYYDENELNKLLMCLYLSENLWKSN